MPTRTSRRSEATKTSNQNRKIQEELDQKSWELFAEESFIGSIFDPQITNRGIPYYLNLTKERLISLLKTPYINYRPLQYYSRSFMRMEGIYYRIIKTYSTMLTYDHMLIPYVENSALEKYKNKLKQSYDTTGIYLEKMNLKSNLPMFAEDFLIDGECYYYKLEDATGIIYQKIDNEFCLPYKNENGLWRFVIDCEMLNTDYVDLSTFPLEIQKAMRIYLDKGGAMDNPMFLFNRYYPVKNGICFSIMKEGKHGTPPFAYLFKDLLALEQKKELKDNIDRVNNTKMIHNKIETKDKETMVDPKVAKKYNDAIKQNLTKKNLDTGIFTITNPFEAQILNLNTKDSQTENLVKDAFEQAFIEAGITSNLFNAGNSSNALEKSIINDASLVINLFITMFQNMVNEELRVNCKTKIRMICKILDHTQYNIENRRTSAESSLAYGGSKLYWQATQGYTPLESLNVLDMENILGINDKLQPVQTSHTMNNDTNKSGRPNADEMKAKGESVSEITDQVNEGK